MDKLVLLSTFNFFNINEAHIIKGLLESEGIEAFIFDELSVSYTPLVGGVRLMVKQSDLERAKKILSEQIADGDFT